MMIPFRLALLFWFLLEMLAFALVAEAIGFGGALLLTFATSAVGFLLLKRRGAAALARFRAQVRSRDDAGGVLGEALAVAGALALLVPGFLSDLAGAALSLPPVRRRAATWVGARNWGVFGRSGGAPMARQDAVIDLEPAEWHSSEPPNARVMRP